MTLMCATITELAGKVNRYGAVSVSRSSAVPEASWTTPPSNRVCAMTNRRSVVGLV